MNLCDVLACKEEVEKVTLQQGKQLKTCASHSALASVFAIILKTKESLETYPDAPPPVVRPTWRQRVASWFEPIEE